MLGFPHQAAAWWMAMLISGAAAGWALCDAQQSWRARRLAGSSRRRLLYSLDCARSGLVFGFALGVLALGGLVGRRDAHLRSALVVGGAAAALYVLILVLQVLLRHRTTQPN